MMLTAFLLVLYPMLFLWCIQHSVYFDKQLPSRKNLSVFFLVRIAVAFFLGWYSFRYHPGSDYVVLHNESIDSKHALLRDPTGYWRDLFYSPYENAYGGFMQGVGSFWHDLKYNLLVKGLSLVNLMSNDSYFVNAVLLNMGGFAASCLLYRVSTHLYPQNKLFNQFACFLLPSTLYYTSGVHKDQLIFIGVGLVVYTGYFSLHDRIQWRRAMLFLLGLFLLLLFRSYLAILLIVLFGLYTFHQYRKSRYWTIGLTLGLVVIGCLFDQWFGYGPMHWIAQRHTEFAALPRAHSQLPTIDLTPSVIPFIQTAPQAMLHGLCSPPAFMQFRLADWLFAIEHTSYLLLLVLSAIRMMSNNRARIPTFSIFLIGLFLALALLSGWIVPNYYSIIRYKSVLLPFLVIPLWHLSTRKKLSN
ncbi:MAG: hypothetical protein ACKO5C_01730 [Ferruginibacter sp.]